MRALAPLSWLSRWLDRRIDARIAQAEAARGAQAASVLASMRRFEDACEASNVGLDSSPSGPGSVVASRIAPLTPGSIMRLAAASIAEAEAFLAGPEHEPAPAAAILLHLARASGLPLTDDEEQRGILAADRVRSRREAVGRLTRSSEKPKPSSDQPPLGGNDAA